MNRKKLTGIIRDVEKIVNYYANKVNCYDNDDIKQKIFHRVIKASKNYNKKYAVKTYFTKVIKHEAYNIVNKQKESNRRNEILTDGLKNLFMSSTFAYNPEDIVINKLMKKHKEKIIENFIKDIPKRTAIVFRMLLEGKKHSEIAKEINLSSSAVASIKKLEIEKISKLIELNLCNC